MKKIFILLFALTTLNGFAQIDPEGTIVLSDTFCFSTAKPFPLVAGSKISSRCDTLYIINKHRLGLYEQAATIIKDKKYMNTCNVLIQNYEDRIQAQNIAFDNLYGKYMSLDSISQTTIAETKNALTQVSNTITSAQNNIVVVDKKMDDLTQIIKEQRRKSFFDKILFGLGGIAVGALGTLIIVH